MEGENKKNKTLARKEKKAEKQKLKAQQYLEKYGIKEEDIVNKEEKFKIKYTWKMFPYLKGNVVSWVSIGILLLIVTATYVIQPIAISKIIDYAVLGDWNKVIIYICLFGLYALDGPLWFIIDTTMNKISGKVCNNMRLDLVNATAKLQVSYFDKVDSGTILTRVNSDPSKFMQNIYNLLMQARMAITDISRVLVIFVISWKIGGFMLLGCAILYICNVAFNRKIVVPAEIRDAKINDMFDSASTEMVKGIRDIKNLNLFTHFYNKFKKVSEYKMNSYKDIGKKNNISESILGFSGLQDLFEIFTLALAVYFAINGEITIGQLTLVITSAYSGFTIAHRFSFAKSALMRMEISARRMSEILDKEKNPRETFGNVVLENPKGEIEFENVGFSYNDEQVFNNLNLKIKPGECVGFVGKSGEGKSTILSLIPRLYDVKEGKIKIDGVDVRDLTADSLRNNVSIVSQSPYIFNMSILDNLRLVKPEASMEEIREACERSAIWDFIQSKPEGLNTKVGEGGVVLSGGQRQRLAIARAFLKGSSILLLDEATSALDNESQGEIKKAIRNMQKTCTIVIVAHRLSTVQDCNKIFVLSKHKIVGEGTHKELKRNCEDYKKLYMQEEN